MRARRVIVSVCLGTVMLFCSGVIAQEPPADPSSAVIDQVQSASTSLVTKVRSAINGDQQAGQELLNELVVPAALALILIIVGYMIASFLGRIVGNLVALRVDKTVGRFTGKALQNTIMVLVFLSALGYFGVDVTSFAAVLAAAGFAIGMALQGTLANFASGIMLLVFRPFQIDDFIKVGDSEGTVEEIDLFTTRLNTFDNRHVIMPNSNVFGATMVNYTRNASRRVDVSVGVAYDADIRHTRRVLEEAIDGISGALAEPEAAVVLIELASSSVNWQCRVWCAPKNYWAVRERVTESVKYALDEAGIRIPFPQLDVHVAGKVLAKAA